MGATNIFIQSYRYAPSGPSELIRVYEILVKIKYKNGCTCTVPTITGGNLKMTYRFHNIHFHWPSEHTVDHKSYDLEAHFVFFAQQLDFKTALSTEDGIVLLAVLFSQGPAAGSHFRNAIATNKDGSRRDISTPVNINDFLPTTRDSFFTYEGSLTTPDCSESVTWFVFDTHPNITKVDHRGLKKIYDEQGKLVVVNNRDEQAINNRIVYFVKPNQAKRSN